MSSVRYQTLIIRDGGDSAIVRIETDDVKAYQEVPLERRRDLAEELAGSDWRVVAAMENPVTTTGLTAHPARPAGGYPVVKGACPSCGAASLFLGHGGYVTCASLNCTDPGASTDMLAKTGGDDERLHDPHMEDRADELRLAANDLESDDLPNHSAAFHLRKRADRIWPDPAKVGQMFDVIRSALLSIDNVDENELDDGDIERLAMELVRTGRVEVKADE